MQLMRAVAQAFSWLHLAVLDWAAILGFVPTNLFLVCSARPAARLG
jgi:hypothetical protein